MATDAYVWDEIRSQQLYAESNPIGSYTIKEISDGDLYVFQPMTMVTVWLTDLVPTASYYFELGPQMKASCRAISPLDKSILVTGT